MSIEIIVPIAAVIVLLLILAWFFKVIKASIKTMLTVAAIFIVLQLAFGINSQEFIQETIELIKKIL